ncbi:MAG TPA: hypothetical protein VEZ48_01135 [Sphingomonadaceae bacterium]|nr:hypothetical protein [Sphingomonadaceae bacterium]
MIGAQRVLNRYLARDRVRDQSAFEDAQRDYRDAAGKREAAGALPRAWLELLHEVEGQIPQIVGDKAEALCGFRLGDDDIRAFLKTLGQAERTIGALPFAKPRTFSSGGDTGPDGHQPAPAEKPDLGVRFTLLGRGIKAANANMALVEILRALVTRDAAKVQLLSDAIRTPKRSQIDRSPERINPGRPDLARAVDIGADWVVGLNISNREKMGIIRTAAKIYGLVIPRDLDISLPNAGLASFTRLHLDGT